MLSTNPTLFSSDAIPTDEKKAAAREFAICDNTVKYFRKNVLTKQETLPFTGKMPSISQSTIHITNGKLVLNPEVTTYMKEVDEKIAPLAAYIKTCKATIAQALIQGKIKGMTSTNPDGNFSSCLLVNLCGAAENIDIMRATQMQLYQSGIKTVTIVMLHPKDPGNRKFYSFIVPGSYEIGVKALKIDGGLGADKRQALPIETLPSLLGNPIIADPYFFEGAYQLTKKDEPKLMEFMKFADTHGFGVFTTLVVDDDPEMRELFYKNLKTGCDVLKPILLQTYKDKILAELAAITGIQWKAPSTFTADIPCAFWLDNGDLEKAKAQLLAKGIPEKQLKIVPWPGKGINFLQIAPSGVGLLALVVGMVPKASLKKEKTPEEKKKKETPPAPPTASSASAPAKR